MMDISSLDPAIVWRHFATLCRIPRASGHEQAIRDAILAWAHARGLETHADATGNLIIRKPGSAGCEERPGVILQGHLDMVCQKRAASTHDFLRDPVRPELREGWLVAPETTLGADNGIGVALALAALETEDLAHPPLEVLLTVDEEAGMSGARGLSAGTLRGRMLLNLDTEDWGEFYLGCAGGADVELAQDLAPQPAPAGWPAFELAVGGLVGGHSGVDIHLQRGNAIKLLVRALQSIAAAGIDYRLASLAGGSARNALPRDASACLLLPRQAAAALPELLDVVRAELAEELAGIDDDFTLRMHSLPTAPAQVLDVETQRRTLAVLDAAPHGVRRMSRRLPGVVDTSNNLGVVRLGPERFEATLMARSLRDSATRALAAEIAALFGLVGAKAVVGEPYPGWTPNPDSALLARLQAVYRREFGGEAAVKVIHAGLECGLLAASHPQLDMVSFGPTIRGAHAPGERVEVASVGRAWRFLRAVLEALA